MDIEGKVGWVAVSLCECESVIELRWEEERREKRVTTYVEDNVGIALIEFPIVIHWPGDDLI